MFNLKGISKSFGRKKVLDDINLDLFPNQITLLLGANGSGKSTLLRICAGLSRAEMGEIVFEGKTQGASQVAKVGHSGHNFFLYNQLSVEENLKLALSMSGLNLDCAEYLESWNLGELLGTSFNDLSEGQKRRVALARTFINEPKFIFLDEPSSSLDQVATETLLLKVRECSELGACILIATHDVHRVQQIAQRVLVIDRGKLVSDSLNSSMQQTFECYMQINR